MNDEEVVEAGEDLAEAAVRVCRHYDDVHRLRLALAGWYKARANESGHGIPIKTVRDEELQFARLFGTKLQDGIYSYKGKEKINEY